MFPDNLRISRIDMKRFEVPVEKLRRQCDPEFLLFLTFGCKGGSICKNIVS
jgi:hypothetical protein